MSIHEIEQEIRDLSRSEQDRIAAFLTLLRLKNDGELDGRNEEYVSWKSVRNKFNKPES